MSLARNDMLTTGDNRRRRRRGVVRVQEPASGFFIAGSSIEGVNGLYVQTSLRRTPDLVVDALTGDGESKSRVGLLYRHCDQEDSGWTLALIKLNSIAETGEGDEENFSDSDDDDNDILWEWVLMDEKAQDRFVHDGDTIIPGAGHERWRFVHGKRASRMKEREERKRPYGWEFGFGLSSTRRWGGNRGRGPALRRQGSKVHQKTIGMSYRGK